MSQPYEGREQTEAKHFILKLYLKRLAMILLEGNFPTLSYVDGFSGPWESRTEDFSDTSFKIALTVLSETAQFFRDRGKPKEIRCFFVEKDKNSFDKLRTEVEKYNQPHRGFIAQASNSQFLDAIPDIQRFTRNSFTLIFIDPKGWTGYDLGKLGPLLSKLEGEVLLNFMFDFINRFTSSQDEPTVESFEPILGKDWRIKLQDSPLPKGEAAEALFLENLKTAGRYKYVLSTKIEKTHERRTHFSLIYATRKYAGLKTFRDIENKALSVHEDNLSTVRTEAKLHKSGQTSLFPETGSFGQLQATAKLNTKKYIESRVQSVSKISFEALAAETMEKFMVRETQIKDICVELSQRGKIEATWKQGSNRRRKPDQNDLLIWIGDR